MTYPAYRDNMKAIGNKVIELKAALDKIPINEIDGNYHLHNQEGTLNMIKQITRNIISEDVPTYFQVDDDGKWLMLIDCLDNGVAIVEALVTRVVLIPTEEL